MGLLSNSSSVDTIEGRVRFTPAPPDPGWMRVVEVLTWVGPPALVILSVAGGDLDTLTIIIGTFWAIAMVLAIGGRFERRGKPSPPSEPVDVPETLLAEVRVLTHAGQDVDALRLVRTEIGVGLIDARKIVDAAVGR